MGVFFTAMFMMITGDTNPGLAPDVVSFEPFNAVLEKFVDDSGRVDYTSLRSDPAQLDSFLEFLANVSPQSRPDIFRTENERKAYWINAYHALIMKSVMDHPGILSVNEIAWGKGVFWRKRFVVGGRKLTLFHIENRILRKRFRDPRIHFVLNCATNSCPPLGNRIVTGKDLDSQLEKSTAQFIRSERGAVVDHSRKEVRLSRIFKWYRSDFVDNGGNALEFVTPYLSDLTDEQREEVLADYRVTYMPYDWGLNEVFP